MKVAVRAAPAFAATMKLMACGPIPLAGMPVIHEGTPADVLTPALVGQLYGIGADLAAPVLA